jgi:predicted RNA-binding protein associated with RNAse of E/G family
VAGYVALTRANRVKHRLTVDYDDSDMILIDDGYKSVIFLPDNDNWCVSAIYNPKGEILEWYFDMTKINATDIKGHPYYIDLYLDIAVSPDYMITILDEDELEDALISEDITRDEYNIAYETCNRLIKEVIPNKNFMVSFFEKYLNHLEPYINEPI